MFCEEERLWLSNRNSILTTYNNVYIINQVVMGFQMQICSILCFSWSISVKCYVHLRVSSSKTQMLLLEKNIFHKYWLFRYRFIAFKFDLFSFLSVVCLSSITNSYNNVTTPWFNQHLWSDSRQILRHQYGISVAEMQKFLLAKHPQRRGEMAFLAGYLLCQKWYITGLTQSWKVLEI